MADQSIRGRFAWHELYTPDEAGAHAFYSKTLGWKSQSWDQDPSYRMFVGPGGPLGGTVAEPTGTPNWLTYIGTDDVAATVEGAQRLGGKVVKEMQTMPNGGSYAILADPQGATFGVYASTAEHGEETAPKRGEFSWHELATNDYKAAFEFYSSLFGWERMAEHDMGPLGVYFIFGAGGVQKGGIFDKPADMKGPPSWCPYVRVKDVNQIVKKAKSARGTVINGPMEVPGGDWIAQLLDPYGAIFAVHAAASDVKSAAAPTPPPREEEQTAAPAPQAAKPAAQPAKKKATARKPAAKKAAKKKAARPAAKSARKTARPAAKKATRKKAAGKKKARARSGGRAAGARKRGAAKSARRPARKAARPAKKAARRKK